MDQPGIFSRLISAGRVLFGRGPADDFLYNDAPYFGPTGAGVYVGPDSAMRATAVLACVRVLSDSVAQIPRHLYERVTQGSSNKRRATEHPIYRLLHDTPNDQMTGYDFFKFMQMHLCLRGNAYAFIELTRGGEVRALIPLHPSNVQVKRLESGEIEYKVYEKQQWVKYPAGKILHVKGLSDDGVLGLSPIGEAREAVGLSLASESYGARFFGNGARPGIAIKVKGKMSADDKEKFGEDWQRRYGRGGAHRPAVLDQETDLTTFGIPPEDAQFLETRQFQVEEIARIYGVPPHMIGAVSKVTSWGTGIEQQSIGFVTYTLQPWLENWAAALGRMLLTSDERNRYFIEFLTDSLVKADIKSRYAAYWTGRQMGVLSANDIRDRENMNPLPAGVGDIYWQPVNMIEAGSTPPNATNDGEDTTRASAAPGITFAGRVNGNGHFHQ